MSSLISPERFRRVMRHVPSPVVVVTAQQRGEPRGVTIGSFTSLSLTPPLISFNIGRTSRIHSCLETDHRFAVHLLTDRQTDLAKRFALPNRTGKEQFDGVSFRIDDNGTPILNDTALILICETDHMVETGDKSIVIGRVLDATASDEPSALLYVHRGFRGIDQSTEEVESPPAAVVSNSLAERHKRSYVGVDAERPPLPVHQPAVPR